MIKGKTGFWLLTVLFSLIIMLTVLNGENKGVKLSEMDMTMSSMKKAHADSSSLSDIIRDAFNPRPSHHSAASEGHHQLTPVIKFLDTGSITVILALLPLLVGFSALLMFLWL